MIYAGISGVSIFEEWDTACRVPTTMKINIQYILQIPYKFEKLGGVINDNLVLYQM